MKHPIVKFALAAFITGWFSPAIAGENLISLGYSGASAGSISGASTTASVIKLEYERKLSDLITLTGGLGALSYTSTNSGTGWTYTEDGKGNSLFLDVNFYPGKQALSGFYVAPGVGLTPISIDWVEVDTGTRTAATNNATLLDVHAKVGWKINAGPVVIDPNLRLGYFLNSPTGGTNQTAGLGAYLLLGVNLGAAF